MNVRQTDGSEQPAASQDAEPPPLEDLTRRFQDIRQFTAQLCEPLEIEDYVVQTMVDVSPTKWHLAHTTWFFETFILLPYVSGYKPLNDKYAFLFNSYYNAVGDRHRRDQRGFISRPTVSEVATYRAYVEDNLVAFLKEANADVIREVAPLVEIGLHHEQQHQELMLTDIKHVLSVNPLRPAYHDRPKGVVEAVSPACEWVSFDEGLYHIGHGGGGFAYDNESPRHRVFLESFGLATRGVTNREYLAFMEDGGYQRPEFWLSEGWAVVEQRGWQAPGYWEQRDGRWFEFTLGGLVPLCLDEPVCHVSYYEADAYASWADARLATEAEWEVASGAVPITGNFADGGVFHPLPARQSGAAGLSSMFGNVWEWTQSPYSPYPGYKVPPGALGEYNGKFMCNQFVLRGGSCATSSSHIRRTYRNFFPGDARWQFTGIRLTRDGGAPS